MAPTIRRAASTDGDQPRSRGFGRNIDDEEYTVAEKKKTFSRNGHDEEEAPRSIKVRTARHEDAKSMRDSAKQMPSVRLTFKEGEARTVRFLHEPFDRKTPWVEYYEHYVQGGGGNGAYVPCIDDCRLDGELRAGKRWYVNVWDRDSKQVRLLKLTGAMVENLIIKYERRGTILDRDYSITRTGEGTDTKYHIEAEEKERFDQRNVKLIDILAYLDQQAQSYYGGVKSFKAKASSIDEDDEEDVEDVEDTEEDDDEEEAPRRGKARSRKVVDEDEEDEPDEEADEEDEEDEEPARTKVKAGRSRKAVEEDEDEDTDDDDDEDDEDDEEETPRRKVVKATSKTATTTKRPLGRRR
jgi:hypothetical protein